METREFIALIHYNIHFAKSKGINLTHITVNTEWENKISLYFQNLFGCFKYSQKSTYNTIFYCGVNIIFSEGIEPEKMIIGVDNLRL